tara:strand:- start:3496 stop:4845 length:1350 start_codon:yes stop_codon:yes gene_type:complete
MSTGTIQSVNLADNINAAFDKVNENFALVETGVFNSVDSNSVTNIVNNILDSDYFLTVINQEYLQQFTIDANVDLTDLENAIAANAASILTLQASITETDSGITVLAQQIQATQAELEGLVLGGIDSDLLADAIANANTTLISRIDATDSSISVFAGNIDSVNASLLLLDSATQDRIDINVNAISSLTASVTANSNGLSAVVADVTQLDIDLAQIISDGITLTPAQVTEAIGGALDELTLRLDADSDKLVLEAGKIVDLDTLVRVNDSDTGVLITAEGNARSALTSRVEVNEGNISTVQGDITTLEGKIDTVDSDGNPTTFLALATESLQTEVSRVEGLITTSASWGIDLVAGTESNPHIAGIKFGNDGATSEFALTADTFRIVNASDNEIQPFTVSGNDVLLSNATVTGQLDIGTDQTGARMELTNEATKIFDSSGQLRVQLGNLAGL